MESNETNSSEMGSSIPQNKLSTAFNNNIKTISTNESKFSLKN